MGFLNMPFIPQGKVSLVAVDYRINPEIEKKLNEMGIECLRTARCKELHEAVDGHPDMLMLHLGGNRIILAPNIYEEMAPELTKKGFAVTKGSTWLVRNYPGNIAYNVLRIGDLVFHNLKYTDKEVIRELEKENARFVDIKQGYAKCSVCILDSRTIVTSDYKLSKIAEKYGIECLLIKPGGITLKPLNYGFIGGASGLLSEKEIAFTGKLDGLEDKNRIIEFLNERGFESTVLYDGDPVDYGSLIPLKCYC